MGKQNETRSRYWLAEKGFHFYFSKAIQCKVTEILHNSFFLLTLEQTVGSVVHPALTRSWVLRWHLVDFYHLYFSSGLLMLRLKEFIFHLDLFLWRFISHPKEREKTFMLQQRNSEPLKEKDAQRRQPRVAEETLSMCWV